MKRRRLTPGQLQVRGVVLPLALCFLLLLTLIAAGASRTSTLEYRLSGNVEQQEALRQMGVGAATVMSQTRAWFDSGLALGERRCDSRSECTSNTLSLPAAIELPGTGSVHYHVERIGPANSELALRLPEGSAFSAGAFGFQQYEVVVELDRSSSRGGRAVVAVGVARRAGVGQK